MVDTLCDGPWIVRVKIDFLMKKKFEAELGELQRERSGLNDMYAGIGSSTFDWILNVKT
jgi:hypothetical protein